MSRVVNYTVMAKRITDLTAAELDALARDAWAHEAESSLQQGLPVTYVENGKVYRRWPDGRCECIAGDDAAGDEGRGEGSSDDDREPTPTDDLFQAPLSVTRRRAIEIIAKAERKLKNRSARNERLAASGGGWRDKANTADD